jgi:hypothetical protein
MIRLLFKNALLGLCFKFKKAESYSVKANAFCKLFTSLMAHNIFRTWDEDALAKTVIVEFG